MTESGTIFNGNNAFVFTGIQNRDIIFLKPPLYTVQQNNVFSNILSGKLLERMNFQWHFSLDTTLEVATILVAMAPKILELATWFGE